MRIPVAGGWRLRVSVIGRSRVRKLWPGRLAAVLVILEGVGLLVLAGWQLAAISRGDTAALDTAVALLVLTLVGAAVVIVFGVVAFRGGSWGRSGGIVTQLLILAVALGAATGAYAHPLTALAIAAVPALVFVLLLIDARRAGEQSRQPSD